MKTIKELNEIMCAGMGVTIAEYDAMNLSAQYKLRQAYLKKQFNLKPKKAK
jgi:hypothetical protein